MKQNSLLGPPSEPQKGQEGKLKVPEQIQKFFDGGTVRQALGYFESSKIAWTVLAQDNVYAEALKHSLPVYAGFKGGQHCRTVKQCHVTIVDASLGMISSTANRLIVQVGNPAIGMFLSPCPIYARLTLPSIYMTVSFTNWQTTVASPAAIAMEHLAQQKVDWLFKSKKVQAELGFAGEPKIVHVDIFPYDDKETQPQIRFHFYGGTKCFAKKPCAASIDYIETHGVFTSRVSDHTGKFLVQLLSHVDY